MGLALGVGENPIVWARGLHDMDTESHAYIRFEQPVGRRVGSLSGYAVDWLGNQSRGVFGYGNGVWGRHPAPAAGRRRRSGTDIQLPDVEVCRLQRPTNDVKNDGSEGP